MASQLARGFLAEQDLERFVREEHGGNRAAAARAKAASGEACMRNAPKAALKYFRDALDLATTEAARAAVHRLAPRRAWRSATLIDASAMRRARWPWTRTISNH